MTRDDPPKVERDNYFDMGLSRQITPAWQITGDTFCKLAKNLLDDGQFGSAVILNNFNYSSGTVYGAELSSTYKQGPFSAYGNYSYVQTWARDIDSVENEFPNNELAYLTTNHMQLDHQGRFTGSGGVSYDLLKNLRVHADFLYGSGLRAGFANIEELCPYCPVNLGVEYIWNMRAAGIRQLKLRFDCLNVLDEPYELRNGTGVGIAAPAYGPRRALLRRDHGGFLTHLMEISTYSFQIRYVGGYQLKSELARICLPRPMRITSATWPGSIHLPALSPHRAGLARGQDRRAPIAVRHWKSRARDYRDAAAAAANAES